MCDERGTLWDLRVDARVAGGLWKALLKFATGIHQVRQTATASESWS